MSKRWIGWQLTTENPFSTLKEGQNIFKSMSDILGPVYRINGSLTEKQIRDFLSLSLYKLPFQVHEKCQYKYSDYFESAYSQLLSQTDKNKAVSVCTLLLEAKTKKEKPLLSRPQLEFFTQLHQFLLTKQPHI